MKETEFTPHPQDEEFLNKLGGKSEVQLGQSELPYEAHLEKFREIHSYYEANKETDPHAVDDMVTQLKDLLIKGDNPPEKERAARDFLKEIGRLED